MRKRSEGYVYAIQTASGPIKIGRALVVKARLQSLQTGSFETLSVLASTWVQDDDEYEKWLHGWLKKHRIRGEWFSPSKEVLEVVDVLKGGMLPEFYGRRAVAQIMWDHGKPDALYFFTNPLLYMLRMVERLDVVQTARGSA